MWKTAVVHGRLVMTMDASTSKKNRELAGVLDDVLDDVKQIGDRVEQDNLA